MLAALGESLVDDPAELCGCSLTLRQGGGRLQCWTRTAADEPLQRAIAARLREALPSLPAALELVYVPHAAKRREAASRR